jgi:hypothetical protein
VKRLVDCGPKRLTTRFKVLPLTLFLVMTELGVAGSMRPWRTFFKRGASFLMHMGSDVHELTLGVLCLTANVLDKMLVVKMAGCRRIKHVHDGISDKKHEDSQGDQHKTTQVGDTTFRE